MGFIIAQVMAFLWHGAGVVVCGARLAWRGMPLSWLVPRSFELES